MRAVDEDLVGEASCPADKLQYARGADTTADSGH